MRLRARTGDCRASAGGQGAADIRMGRSKKGRWGGGCMPEGGVRSEGTQSRTPREAPGLCPLWREVVAGREGRGWGGWRGGIEGEKKEKEMGALIAVPLRAECISHDDPLCMRSLRTVTPLQGWQAVSALMVFGHKRSCCAAL